MRYWCSIQAEGKKLSKDVVALNCEAAQEKIKEAFFEKYPECKNAPRLEMTIIA